MNEELTPNHVEDDESLSNSEESDFINLINRLGEIAATIDLLEKQYLAKS